MVYLILVHLFLQGQGHLQVGYQQVLVVLKCLQLSLPV
ncbi:hypothetical protein GLYMA_13G366366v4 [Glycine max]|nr:hypothetical protein GLYMA_13G366366v4 [Glycine max]KAH1105272.1 hypothetical protein GYH30_038505 [Glycine max]